MFGLGSQELILVLLIAFLIFGGKKLPEIGKALGKGIREFKKGLKNIEDDTDESSAKQSNTDEKK